MLNITFNKTKPSQRQYEYSIVGNAKVDVVRFVLQNDICSEYSLDNLENHFNAYVKVQSAGGEYIDKISATSSYDSEKETLTIDFSLLKKTTQFKNISLQLQFESDEGQVVAQTEIVCLSLKGSIKADKEIPDLFPSVLTQMEHELADHEERIEELEKGGTGSGKVDDVKVNGESVVQDKVANIDLTNYATKEELSGKQDVLTFDNEPTEDSSNPVKSGGVYTACENIRQVAEGKCKSYTISIDDNADFNTQNASISGITSITDISGNVVQVSTLKNGDIILVIETDVPDRWYSTSDSKFYILETAKVDLTAYANKSADETITGTWTFNEGITFANDYAIVKSGSTLVATVNGTNVLILGSSSTALNSNFRATSDNSKDLGTSSIRWKDLYLSGKIKDGTNEWDFNSIGFPVISKPSSTTLTADEKAAIVKGVCINGTFLTYDNIVFYPASDYSGTYYGKYYVGGRPSREGTYQINSSNIISLTADKNLRIEGIDRFNGKIVPDYPSSTGTFVLKCVDGTLTWVAE